MRLHDPLKPLAEAALAEAALAEAALAETRVEESPVHTPTDTTRTSPRLLHTQAGGKTDEKHNRKKALNRQEFMQSIVKMACMRYVMPGEKTPCNQYGNPATNTATLQPIRQPCSHSPAATGQSCSHGTALQTIGQPCKQ